MPNGQQPTTQVVVPGQGWVDVASRAIVQVGFPVVVAGVLLWFLLTRFQDNMNMIVQRMSSNTEVVARLISNEEQMLKELQGQRIELSLQTQYLKDITEKSQRILTLQEERQKFQQKFFDRENKGKQQWQSDH